MNEILNGFGKYIKYAMIVLVVVLVVLGIFLLRSYMGLLREQVISTREFRLSASLREHGPLTANDVGVIRPWMTFDYINLLFKVPPSYLQKTLSISATSSYPQISIYNYAGKEGVNSTMVTDQVESALYNYLTASSMH